MYLVYIITVCLFKVYLILFSHLCLHNCEYLFSLDFSTKHLGKSHLFKRAIYLTNLILFDLVRQTVFRS